MLYIHLSVKLVQPNDDVLERLKVQLLVRHDKYTLCSTDTGYWNSFS